MCTDGSMQAPRGSEDDRPCEAVRVAVSLQRFVGGLRASEGTESTNRVITRLTALSRVHCRHGPLSPLCCGSGPLRLRLRTSVRATRVALTHVGRQRALAQNGRAE
jgi:hypothetical protein